MKVTHKIPRLKVDRDNCDADSFVLSNKAGSFLFLSSPVQSKFNGFFLNDEFEMFKTVENIRLEGSKATEVENHLTHIKRKYKDNAEKFTVPEGINGIVYALNKKSDIEIDVDCRKVSDMRTYGRYYDISFDKNNIILKFTKKTDEKEDSSHGETEYELFAVIQPKSFDLKKDYQFVDEWVISQYDYDLRRNDSPSSRYVYRPFIITAKEILIAFGRTEKEAYEELEHLKKFKQEDFAFDTVDKKKASSDIAAAFVCAQQSLESMTTLHEGIERLYAGYPWFFQVWSRDENISLGALIRLRRFKKVKAILFEYIKNISEDGRLPNHIPSPHLGSADGIGWFWKRVGDFIAELKELHLEGKYLSPKEMKDIREALEGSIDKIEKAYLKEGMVFSRNKETWMDTDWEGQDGREGFPIEIQCLHLNMLSLMHRLTDDDTWKDKEDNMKKKVVKAFWKKDLLADTRDDPTQRPNIFIAYYVYPDLISRREWQSAFETCLKKTWLDWGGLASISKDCPLFTTEYTGRTNKSYHRGDSWYWLNYLAALCMYRNNPIDFDDIIRKIIEAGSEEILWRGAIGHNAEVSSAKELSSFGCFAQAWSAAMFIELVLEVYGDGK